MNELYPATNNIPALAANYVMLHKFSIKYTIN